MATFIRLSKLTEEGIKKVRKDRNILLTGIRASIESNGGKLVGAWATQGRYNIVSIIEAPDEKAMSNIEAEISGMRIYTTQTLPGIPIETFLQAFQGDSLFAAFLENWLTAETTTQRRRR